MHSIVLFVNKTDAIIQTALEVALEYRPMEPCPLDAVPIGYAIPPNFASHQRSPEKRSIE